MAEVNFAKIEKKWQTRWAKERVFEVNEKSDKKKFYMLEMFPYPSGDGLHMGHALNYTIGDVFARFKIMQGFNVMHPMGYDALGLPAENAAIKAGTHPEEYTNKAIKNYVRQHKALGISYDWTRMVNTADPDYYKWDQWIFLKMLEKGLAYQKESEVNWCPKCDTVLANEQVHNGKCWRHEKTDVKAKKLKQWFLKITDYADELYAEIDRLEDWPERTKIMQKNWIGKSHGTEIDFEIIPKGMTSEKAPGEKWAIFTTRPDTIFGVTFMVVSAQHEKLMDLVTDEQKKDVEKFLKKVGSVSEKDVGDLEKEGVFTGSYAINPANGEKVPVWAGNFVIADYGSGMVMAVPSHCVSDFDFAKKYEIDIKQVVAPLFVNTNGPDAVRKNKKTIERDAVFGIVKHWKDDKYFCLDWKKFGWRTPIIGGIDDGESAKEAVVREVKEETGYQDVKSVERISIETHSNFFARHKDENRYGRFKTFLVNLGSDKFSEPEEEHVKNHDGVWVDKKDVKDFLSLENHSYIWNEYLKGEGAYTGEGVLINSGEFDGLNNDNANDKITAWLKKKKLGRKTINYKLRDWGISRQRYWGTPIPIIHCEKCGAVPVPEKDLPVKLPKKVKFGKGNPLETADHWLKVKCPKCNGEAKRETDTMDTFVNSSWYFLRYCDPHNDKKIFDPKKVAHWCPVDMYIGGAEHACMHLIYFRFYTKFLRDLGLLNFDEPAQRLFHQGMLHGDGGVKMSKSKGNVVNPDDVSKKYGIDTARYFLLSLAAPDKPRDWSESGIHGSLRLVKKIFGFFDSVKIGKTENEIASLLNKAIKGVGDDIETFRYRMATIKLKELFETMSKKPEMSKDDLGKSLKLLSPFCPHIAEELWEKIGGEGFISLAKWPEADESKIVKRGGDVDLNDRVVGDVKYFVKRAEGKAKKVYLYVMPFEMDKIDVKKISADVGLEVKVFAVNDAKKKDPEGKAKKAKPGKPSVWLE